VLFVKVTARRRIAWTGGTAIVLTVAYLLCRYVFWTLHGMKSFPLALFVCGLAVIALAGLVDSRGTQVGAPAGYIVGFVAALCLNSNSVDPGAGMLNNAWIIWAAVFLAALLIGIIFTIIHRRYTHKKEQELKQMKLQDLD
jgi:Na+/proline symporter